MVYIAMMKRTQLYLEESLLQFLTLLSHENNTTISDLVRKAIKKVYGSKKKKQDFSKAINMSFGILKNRKDLPSTDAYIRSLRKNTRLKCLGLE